MINLNFPNEIWTEIIPYTNPEALTPLSIASKELSYLIGEYKIKVSVMNKDLTIKVNGECMKCNFKGEFKLFDEDAILIIKDKTTSIEEKILKIKNCINNLLSNWLVSNFIVRKDYINEIEVLLKLGANPNQHKFLIY